MNGGHLLADDQIGSASTLAGNDQFNGLRFNDDHKGGKGGDIGAALRRFQGAAHTVQTNPHGDNLTRKWGADTVFLDLALQGSDSQLGAGDRLYQGWVYSGSSTSCRFS